VGDLNLYNPLQGAHELMWYTQHSFWKNSSSKSWLTGTALEIRCPCKGLALIGKARMKCSLCPNDCCSLNDDTNELFWSSMSLACQLTSWMSFCYFWKYEKTWTWLHLYHYCAKFWANHTHLYNCCELMNLMQSTGTQSQLFMRKVLVWCFVSATDVEWRGGM